MNTVNIFTGAFNNEQGQRLLRIFQNSCDVVIGEMFQQCSADMERYKSLLARIRMWDRSFINDEMIRLRASFPDSQDMFRAVYIMYIKEMRSSKTTRLILTPPRIELVWQRLFVNFSEHSAVVREAHYFTSESVVEKRVICMDVLRDTFYEFSGKEYVRTAPVPPPPTPLPEITPPPPSPTATALPPPTPPPADVDDAESRVVSEIFECNNIIPDDNSIGPDDSVSCVDFAEKQHRQLAKMRIETPIAEEEKPLRDEDEQSKTSLSLSLSSVSITEHGPVMKKNTHMKTNTNPHPNRQDDEDRYSDQSSTVTASSVSSVKPNRTLSTKHRKRSPQRSYITSLTEESGWH